MQLPKGSHVVQGEVDLLEMGARAYSLYQEQGLSAGFPQNWGKQGC